MAYFTNAFIMLEDLGLLDSVLPFLLIYIMIFAVLQKTKVIGDGRKQFNTIVALVVSLMAVIPHVTGKYPPGQDIIVIINTAIPQIALIVVAILAAMLLIGVFVPGALFGAQGFGAGLVLLSLIAVAYIFGSAAGFWSSAGVPAFLEDPDTQAILIIILVFALIVYFITRDNDPNNAQVGGPLGGILNSLRDWVGPR